MNESQMNSLILKMSDVLSMKKVCERAGVNYQVFRNWKSNGSYFSYDKKALIVREILNVSKEIEDFE